MVRDFVAGVLWGGVVASVGLGVISQVSTLPPTASPAAEIAEQTASIAETEGESATITEQQPLAEPAPQIAAPAAPVVEADPVPTPPTTVAPQTQLAAADPAPVLPGASSDAPVLPQSAEASVAAASDAAPASTVPPAPAGLTANLPAPIASNSEVSIAPPLPPGSETQPAPAPEVGPVSMDAPAEPLPQIAELPPKQAPNDTLLVPAAPMAEPPLPAEIVPDTAPLPQILPDQPLESKAIEPQPIAPKPSLIVPDGGQRLAPDPALKLGEGSRLPSIGDAPAAATDVVPVDLRPIARFAAKFDNPGGKPTFAILLVDPGTADIDRVKLAALPFPVTFVLDPQAANAAEAAATYRAAGKEVVMLATGIPEGATASDLEQTFQSNANVLPETVAVIDLSQGGFQDDRPLATQVVPILKAEGRGLITFDRGLNAADQVARREDVAAAVIFRNLDAEDEEAAVIRRYLDRAAFKAAQDGRVLVIGTVRLETVAAILEWTVEGRASSVALAPATAVLRVE